MKKETGFTLIELLAVIVILAIIALIATPLIMNIISEAKKGAFEDSSYAIIAAAEQGYATSLFSDEDSQLTKYTYTDGEMTLISGNVEINYKGSNPKSGILIINEDGETAITFYNNGYCITKGYSASKLSSEKLTEEECLAINIVSIPNVPELEDTMIPIVYDEANAVWVKADTSSTWYDYEQQWWANVVLVTEDSRSNYQNAAVGTTIEESDVLAYLV
ncbi:MAG: prepilin-type N-terminal cleavage/methylation domain-containing protein, partial [Bacilli bacterium]|nr:prepilin-type N-terminal cleavage/methylation domain-containing protein [Bacilli bacterium]